MVKPTNKKGKLIFQEIGTRPGLVSAGSFSPECKSTKILAIMESVSLLGWLMDHEIARARLGGDCSPVNQEPGISRKPGFF